MHSPSILMIIAAFALMLGPLIVLHELGHYLVGRWFGVKIDAFSVGFGKELLGWTDKRGTRWKLSLLPLGGYVQFSGDMNAMSMPDTEKAALSAEDRVGNFHFMPLWQRALIVAAGPVTNLLVTLAIFSSFNLVYGRIVASPVIAAFAPASTAQSSGLLVGDKIVAIDGAAISRFDEIRDKIMPYPGEVVKITVERGGKQQSFGVDIATKESKDEFGNVSRIGLIGVASGKAQIVRMGPVEAVHLSVTQSVGIIGMMVTGIQQIVTGKRSVDELGGPVKIAQYSGQQLSLGWLEFVYFAAFISINLAFINVLPIPALDGGHLAFYAVEAIRGKPMSLASMEWAFRGGMSLVLGLMLFVTANDLASLKLFANLFAHVFG